MSTFLMKTIEHMRRSHNENVLWWKQWITISSYVNSESDISSCVDAEGYSDHIPIGICKPNISNPG